MNTDTLLNIEDLHVSFFTPAGEVKAVTSVTYSMKHGEVLESLENPEAEKAFLPIP